MSHLYIAQSAFYNDAYDPKVVSPEFSIQIVGRILN